MQEVVLDDPLSLYVIQVKEEDEPKLVKQIAYLEADGTIVWKKEFEEIDGSRRTRLKPSIEDPPTLELKELPDHLEYAFLGENSNPS